MTISTERLQEIELLAEELTATDICPFCGCDPYHYVDVGLGGRGAPSAIVCCDHGIALYQYSDEGLSRASGKLHEAGDALRELLALERREAMGAIADIAAERRRQVEAEGWTPEHDDQHDYGELARAAACYAMSRRLLIGERGLSIHHGLRDLWPWGWNWWKPKDRRRDLVRAGALIAAEIDRLDRLSALADGGQP